MLYHARSIKHLARLLVLSAFLWFFVLRLAPPTTANSSLYSTSPGNLPPTAQSFVSSAPGHNGATQQFSARPRVNNPLYLPLVVNAFSSIPNFSRVWIIIMENKDYSQVVGNSNAPYFNTLIKQYGLATNYTGVTHPSQPNYVALFSGSTQGITNDNDINLPGQNIVDQLEAKGKTWGVFAEDYPLNCSAVTSSPGGSDSFDNIPPALGYYTRKHNPAISFDDIRTSSTRCANITDFSHFNPNDPFAPDYELIVPNMCNDTHDVSDATHPGRCDIPTGDEFLRKFVPGIINNPVFAQGVLFIIYDEDASTQYPNVGAVAAVVISNYGSISGQTSAIAHNHYSLLRTIEDAWGLGCLNNSCTANNLAEFFR